MARIHLIQARLKKHWTVAQAAEHLEVGVSTLIRWEKGTTTAYPYNVQKIREVYGPQAWQEHEPEIEALPPSDAPVPIEAEEQERTGGSLRLLVQEDLMLRLLKIVLTWPHRNTQYHELQARLMQETEDYSALNHSTDDLMSRRDALRRLALLPVELYGLTSLGPLLNPPVEEFLTRCAAGITACEYMSNSANLSSAFSIVSTYLPTLTAIARTSSFYRQAAAHLITQCLFLKTILAMHLQGVQQAIYYAEQAVKYSKESNEIPLRITALGRLAWIYSCDKQQKLALEKAQEARSLLEHTPSAFPPEVHSYVFGVLAKYQALNRQQREALTSLQRAHAMFFTSPTDSNHPYYAYMDHDLANFLLDDGATHIFMGQYQNALETFARMIDPHNLSPRIPIAERIYVEVLNNQTLAMLKQPDKDMEQIIYSWRAGIQGARALQSKQRFAEACAAFDMMESVWSNERRIKNLRELTMHW